MAAGARRGFTLIELLCVISIIAVLAGMAFPVYTNFRDKSDGVQCVSNLRQIGTAVQGFVGQNDGVFPEIETDPASPVYPPESNAKGLQETLAPYGITKEVVKCPADVRSFNYYAKRGTSFEWAPYVDDELQSAPQIFTRRGQFSVPLSRIVVCFDTERVHGVRSDSKSKKNYLFADGHVRAYWETAPRSRPSK
jgi:prepilin-type N-terminal cleavage/methylation domain-containing protein/prepilin-type processing-associated H-X9-DG protein